MDSRYEVKLDHPIGGIVGIIVSTWASFAFLRDSILGSPPLKSKVKRSLHFVAGIGFGLLAIEIGILLANQ